MCFRYDQFTFISLLFIEANHKEKFLLFSVAMIYDFLFCAVSSQGLLGEGEEFSV